MTIHLECRRPAFGPTTAYEVAVIACAKSPPAGGIPYAPTDFGSVSGIGSAWQFVAHLRSSGVSLDGLVAAFPYLSLAHLGRILEVLEAIVRDHRSRPEMVACLAELLADTPTDQLDGWMSLLGALWSGHELTDDVREFVHDKGIVDLLRNRLYERMGLPLPRQWEARDRPVAESVSGYLRFLSQWWALISTDPDLTRLWAIDADYDSLASYYLETPATRRVLQRMIEKGFKVEEAVLGGESLLEVGPMPAANGAAGMGDQLRDLARHTLGRGLSQARLASESERRRLHRAIATDLAQAADDGDADAAMAVLEVLTAFTQRHRAAAVRDGDIGAEIRALQALSGVNQLRRGWAGAWEAHHLSIRLSHKHLPGLLFDNERMACCLFKPTGLCHGEITRLLLDPATPLLECRLSPYAEFLGLATVYPGTDARGRTTLLLDTFEYDERLVEAHGVNSTMRLVLAAVARYAHRINAAQIAIFAEPYGRPLRFASYVDNLAGRSRSIRHYERFYFEAAEPFPSSAILGEGRSHYTVALGYGRPLVGVIEYGFSIITPGQIYPLRTAGRGVYLIDVAAFLEEFGLVELAQAAAAGTPQANLDHVLHSRPEGYSREIGGRVDRALERVQHQIAGIDEGLTVRAHDDLDDSLDNNLIDDLLRVESQVFPDRLRYDAATFRERTALKDAELLTLHHADELVGFALYYATPLLPPLTLFVDDLALLSAHQGRGLGSRLLAACTARATARGYRSAAVLTERAATGFQLRSFYLRLGWTLSRDFAGGGTLLKKDISFLSADYASYHAKVLQRFGADDGSGVTLSLTRGDEPGVIAVIESLERSFPTQLQYTAVQIAERLRRLDGFAIIAYDGDAAIGFGFGYHDPAHPDHVIYFDSMAIASDRRREGLGGRIMRTMLALPGLANYTDAVFHCLPVNEDGVDLVAYYEAFGARVMNRSPHRVRMRAPIAAIDELID